MGPSLTELTFEFPERIDKFVILSDILLRKSDREVRLNQSL